jgi:cell division protein FtsI (penicillin-binding protein 3)
MAKSELTRLIFRPSRHWILLALAFVLFTAMFGRAFWLGAFESQHLIDEADLRHVRVLEVKEKRGDLLDRNGVLLARSLPFYSVFTDPKHLLTTASLDTISQLSIQLGLSPGELLNRLKARENSRMYYIKDFIEPQEAEAVRGLKIPGVFLEKRFKRYYPEGETTGQLLGLTDRDDQGQEGLERVLDEFLTGEVGQRKVIKDRYGVVMEDVETLLPARFGQDIRLSIDSRVQYSAYRALKNAVYKHRAVAGSAVVLNAQTGEILALVSQPAFNPNDRSKLDVNGLKNRPAMEIVEQGSTIKPFTLATAIEKGIITPHSKIDARPGYLDVAGQRIRDARNYGELTPEGILQHSSNVASAKLAMQIGPVELWKAFKRYGLDDFSGFPKEELGYMRYWTQWGEQGLATHSYGYGFSTNLLQLARAYTIFANQGRLLPLSILPVKSGELTGEAVLDPKVAQEVLSMLEAVPRKGGTAPQAGIKGYSVAGKTGTTHKFAPGGYSDEKYRASFAGIVPANNPRFIMLVSIDEPRIGSYFGGSVAGPVFSEVMSQVLRIYQVEPDQPAELKP